MKKTQVTIFMITLVALFFGAALLNNLFLSKFRLDLTENQVYSLSDGSKSILQKMDEPIHLYFFFSDKTSEGMTQIRNYAQRVQSLLEEYELYSNGKLKLQVIDPEPFSEAEDKAAEFGLTAAQVGAMGESLYFGLGARNSVDDQEIIAFFDPAKETFLEYDISKLLNKLSDADKVKIGLITDLPITGGPANPMNPMAGVQSPWVFYQQLTQMYQVEQLTDNIPDDLDTLMLINPSNLSDDLTFAIDQYLMKGGKVLAFIDPLSESNPDGGMPTASPLAGLVNKWGISFEGDQVVLDAAKSLEIRLPSGGSGKHFGFLGLTQENISKDDAVTGQLDSINGASFGYLELAETNSGIKLEPLFTSSEYASTTSSMLYMSQTDPVKLQTGFTPSGEVYTLAARIHGEIKSAYADDEEYNQNPDFTSSNSESNLILIADTDLLADRFWVQTSNFFGQAIATPFANNGDLVANAVENLSGSSDLISIRARGKFSRPFTKVEELEVKAQAQFREKEQALQARLSETEQQLSQLQTSESGNLVLSDEQELAIKNFLQEKINIRKELREVRHQLDKDIDELGSWLKFLNIAVAPIVLTFLLFLLSLLFKRRRLV
ncbi:GldG family protein [Catenovulum maritimum]|uniref:ABC transporter n=1 Tax=Catenovulum maritimum TaxID=1513271 RepID=A0A0J8GYX6_9ALTE|nr:GldG family protein [Catenovulum maritimum]KMT66449.1 ABC transporter [Catenovulum maritimum]